MLLLATAVLLSLWFFRQNFKDGTLWMLATYVGVGLMLWTNYEAVTADHQQALPKIVRDFMLLGMVGFVQSLAVAKRINIATAVVIIFTLFAGAYFLQEMLEEDGQQVMLTQDAATPNTLASDAELLVEVANPAGARALERLAATNNWTLQPAFSPNDPNSTDLDDYYTLDVTNVPAAEQLLAATKGVEYFEPNEEIQLSPFEKQQVNADEMGSESLTINDPFADQQWSMRVLNMNDYYRALENVSPVRKAKIAILDTGVDGQHEDITDNYFSIETKYDNDPMGHGTHCAGIAAGVTNNAIGIGSLAGNNDEAYVQITSVKVLNAAGMGTQKSIIAGIIEATDEGADVISLSLGGPSNGSRQKAYSAAVKYAHDHGAIVVAAAGNSNMDAYDYAPANATGMITVAALDEYLQRAPFSNKVDRLQRGIAAPGVAIYSTTPNSTYKAYSGTSMACPFVAGLLGVMKSINPDLSAAEAYNIINGTGRDIQDGTATGRVVQPAEAIRALTLPALY